MFDFDYHDGGHHDHHHDHHHCYHDLSVFTSPLDVSFLNPFSMLLSTVGLTRESRAYHGKGLEVKDFKKYFTYGAWLTAFLSFPTTFCIGAAAIGGLKLLNKLTSDIDYSKHLKGKASVKESAKIDKTTQAFIDNTIVSDMARYIHSNIYRNYTEQTLGKESLPNEVVADMSQVVRENDIDMER